MFAGRIAASLLLATATTSCQRPDTGVPQSASTVTRSIIQTTTLPTTTTTSPTSATTPSVVVTTPAEDVTATTGEPATVPVESSAPESTSARDAVLDCVELTTRELAALVSWPAVVTADWSQAIQVVGELGVGGVLLMEPDDEVDEATLASLIDELDAASELGVMVATDEEGGSVQRLRQFGPLPSQRAVSERMSPADALDLITDHGQFVSDVGIDVVLGPVVDVAPASGTSALNASRFFAGSPADVAEYADAYVEGWLANGLLPTLKHFPGHGSASADTHDSVGLTPPLDALTERDLVPYRVLADRHSGSEVAVMVGHLDVPGLTDSAPASLSTAAVEYLRDDLGFSDSLVISDALDMGAVDLPVNEAAVATIAAGVDVALFADTSATEAVIDAIDAAVATEALPADRLQQAAGRVLSHLGRAPSCPR